MVGALFDTNILIDFLAKLPQAREELDRYARRAISVVTWMEILVGTDPRLETETRMFLRRFSLIDLDTEIAERAVLRRQHRMKIPDAMIWASAQVHGLLFVTRNTKDFPESDPGVRAPYTIQ